MTIQVYVKKEGGCSHCERIVNFLNQRNVPFEMIMFDKAQRRQFYEHYDWKTAPMCFVDGKFVGGADQMIEHIEKNPSLVPVATTITEKQLLKECNAHFEKISLAIEDGHEVVKINKTIDETITNLRHANLVVAKRALDMAQAALDRAMTMQSDPDLMINRR